ncbi:hypothetical protein [Croceicoccus bisphenolivorans]|uniref:hypothetical protein n=1 Tax=Croceicoccus bisphenolivorans TaxID=1783232 RepID=UPI00082EDAA4|nr:hypothetical protein [Croceicoccus bisphenolivorans]
MRTGKWLASGLAMLIAAGCVHGGTPYQDREEARLAKMLKDRVAGEPASCIAAFSSSRLKILDRTAVVYDAGDTIWVARPHDPASLDAHDIVVIERTGSQLCKYDIVRTIDRNTQSTSGVIMLGDFVPYRR